MEWKYLPDTTLQQIFKNLDVCDVICCSEVCVRWNAISKDTLIWKHLFFRRFEIVDENSNREDGFAETINTYINWKSVCVRLINEFPSIFIPTRLKHKLIIYHTGYSLAGTKVTLKEGSLVVLCIKTMNVEYNLVLNYINLYEIYQAI